MSFCKIADTWLIDNLYGMNIKTVGQQLEERAGSGWKSFCWIFKEKNHINRYFESYINCQNTRLACNIFIPEHYLSASIV